MKHFRKFAFLGIIAIVIGCSKNEPSPPSEASEKGENPAENFSVSERDAKNIMSFGVIELSQSNARVIADSSRKIIRELKSLVDENNKEVLFVGNYENNKGWMVLSADRRMQPVLAYSETGSFDLKTDNPGIKWWLGTMKNLFKEAQKLKVPKDNERFLWEQYDYSKEHQGSRTMSYCSDLYDQLPPMIEISNLTDQYSRWSQGSGYNHFSPALIHASNCSSDCDKAPTGCGPVAVAQVLRYYRKPVTIDGISYTSAMFDAMPYSFSGCDPTEANRLNVASLIRGVGKGVDAVYNTQIWGSGAQVSLTGCQTWNVPGNIDDFFRSVGYSSFSQDYPLGVFDEITSYRPVIVFGSSCATCLGDMHIWVVDGVKHGAYVQTLYEPNCLDTTNPNEPRIGIPNARTTQRVCCAINYATWYDMNWGWGNSYNNGWYYIYPTVSGTTYNSSNMKAYIVRP